MLILVTPSENFERFATEMSERALLTLPLPEMLPALNELGPATASKCSRRRAWRSPKYLQARKSPR